MKPGVKSFIATFPLHTIITGVKFFVVTLTEVKSIVSL